MVYLLDNRKVDSIPYTIYLFPAMIPSEGSTRYLGRSYLFYLFNTLFYLEHLDPFGKSHADMSGIT